MSVFVVEEDRVLRLVQVILDPSTPAERVAAFADYNSTDLADFAGWLEDLRARIPALYPSQVHLVTSQEELRRHLPQADVAIVESLAVGAEELAVAKRLALVQNFGVVADNVDAVACGARSIPVHTLRRLTNVAMGEHTMTLVQALAKRLGLLNGLVTVDRLAQAGFTYRPYDSRHTASANFGRIPDLRTLHGSTLGLLGFGEIGREVAALARAFGMKVAYHKRSRLDAAQEQALGVTYCSFEELFATSEYLSVHVPFSEHTKDLVDRAAIDLMQPGSYLVNTSRAGIVNHDALVAALQSGQLAGAGLDVLYGEPSSNDEALLKFSNVVLTPHMGGASRMNGLKDMQTMLLALNEALPARR